MNIVLLGKPGAGKGYVSDYLKNKYGFVHISTGELCRKSIKENTELGKLVDEYISRGNLVPSNIILEMLKQELSKNQGKNIILDGFPRTIDQAEALQSIVNVDVVIEVDVPDSLILKRIAGRRVCPTCSKVYSRNDAPSGICLNCNIKLVARKDDDVNIAKQRLKTYETETKPLIDYYKDKIIKLDNSGAFKDTIFAIDSIAKGVLKLGETL